MAGIEDWLQRSAIAFKATAATKRQALAIVADLGARAVGLDAATVLEALLEREHEGSTGVGSGVALPHARLTGLERTTAVFVRLETPVAYDAVDDHPVDLLFALFAPSEADASHLRALAKVSRLLRLGDLRQQIRQARSADALYALLVQEAARSAA